MFGFLIGSPRAKEFDIFEGLAMVDVAEKKSLQVSTDGTAGPYLMVSLDALRQVKSLLDSHGIRYFVDEQAISIDGSPYVTLLDFGLRGDADLIQSLLDSVQ